MKYFFALGRNPLLSFTEIISVLTLKKIKHQVLIFTDEIAIFDIEEVDDSDISSQIKTLGGTVKIGKIVDAINLDESEDEFENLFATDNLINNFLPPLNGKLHLGISIYNGGGDRGYLDKLTSQLKSLNTLVKENLQEKEVRIGFVRIKERFLSSVSVVKNQLLNKGVELILILTEKEILMGKTQTVQEFEDFTKRDYFRPWKNKKKGIIPAKLARMMINLAKIDKNAVLIDPFCGGGTILQEAIVLGYQNIFGTDLDSQAIISSRKNIDWLFDNFRNFDISSYNIKIFQSDVRLVSRSFESQSVDAIVTEPYLGPPLYSRPDFQTIIKIINEVGVLYIQAFKQFVQILKPKGKVIFVFPVFIENGRMHFVEIMDKIKQIGFRRVDFFPQNIKNHFNLRLTARDTILYGSGEHFLKREILSFEKI